jgi:hypothetical protein
MLDSQEAIVYAQKERAALPPDLCQLRNGELLAAVREAANHTDPGGNIGYLRSRDGGHTWAPLQIIKPSEEPSCDYRDPSICELGDGTLIVTFFRWDAPRRGTWTGAATTVMRSFDGGLTWPDEQVLPTEPFDFLQICERCIELPSGRVLMPAYGGREEQCSATCYSSDDKGASWQYLSTIQTHPWTEDDSWFMETSIALTQDAKIAAVSRTNAHMLQATSYDMGNSWTDHRELDWTPPETQPSLNCLQDGRLLLMYGDRGPKPRLPDYPFAIVGYLSEDEGRTWGEALILEDGLPHWDMGYPTSVELEPGHMLTVYWRSEPSDEGQWPHNMRYVTVGRHWTVPPAQGDR